MALRTDHITTAIPGLTAFEHIDQDFAVAFDLSYTEEERQLLGTRLRSPRSASAGSAASARMS